MAFKKSEGDSNIGWMRTGGLFVLLKMRQWLMMIMEMKY